MKFLEKYYPIILAFLSFLYSVYLWFTGNELEGIYVGLWPITILGFAIAASLAAITFTFFNSPSQISESMEISYLDQQIVDDEEAEQIFISGEEMINGLWGPSSELAREIGRDRYEIMYAVYEANKDNFIDNDINQPKQDETFFVDLSLVENLDKSFVIDEVKRHIFCSC